MIKVQNILPVCTLTLRLNNYVSHQRTLFEVKPNYQNTQLKKPMLVTSNASFLKKDYFIVPQFKEIQ